LKSGSLPVKLSALRCVPLIMALCLASVARPTVAQGWPGYAHDPQHSCMGVPASQIPQQIRWSTPVDLQAPYTNGILYIHYGSPVITRLNTVLVPVKTTSNGDWRIEAHSGVNGSLMWTTASDFTLPAHDWVPIFGITLTPKDRYLVYPGAGGTIYQRTFPDTANLTPTRLAFYGISNYNANPSAFNSAIQICTPITSDRLGNLTFGYVSNGAALPGYPNGIPSGLARISNTGVGSFVSAAVMSGDPTMQKVAYNCAPAISNDGSTLYVTVNTTSSGSAGYLCALDSTTLAFKSSVLLRDPRSTQSNPLNAWVDDDGSATPTVAPDGDVYYGVLENNFPSNHARGFLLHFDSTLATSKLPSAFGWDDTASIVPANLITSYTGPSSYLLLTKFNNYAEAGGDGANKVAIVDPNVSMTDPISGATVMNVVMSVVGPTPDSAFPTMPHAVREWCINSAAIDVVNKCAVINCEDGHVYRWDFNNTQSPLSPGLMLAPPTGEAYTPTVIGPDGACYAINNAVLYSCIAAPSPKRLPTGPPHARLTSGSRQKNCVTKPKR
jgi:hypothetical protein